FAGSSRWDAAQSFDVERARRRGLLPTPGLRRRGDAIVGERGAAVGFLDPLLPLGGVGPRFRAAPHRLIAHGAAGHRPGRLPRGRALAGRVLRSAAGLVAAGEYRARVAAGIAGVALPTLVVPPGVDADRFRPLGTAERSAARNRFGLAPDRPLVLGLSRLVPRKGFDVLIDAVAGLDREVQLAIGGARRGARRPPRPAPARGGTRPFTLLGP